MRTAAEAFAATIAAHPLTDDHKKSVTDVIDAAIAKGWVSTSVTFPEVPSIVQNQIIDWLRGEGYTVDLAMRVKGRTVFSVGWGEVPVPKLLSCDKPIV